MFFCYVEQTNLALFKNISFIQQCISSAMPINRKKLPKSSSDSQVTGSAGRQNNRAVPRSKTFGSKLRIPSKKSLKAAQLAKVIDTAMASH